LTLRAANFLAHRNRNKMSNEIAKLIEKFTYLFLLLNLFWGVFCAIVVWRRIKSLSFKKEAHQNEFMDEVLDHLTREEFDDVSALCDGDGRALPQLITLALDNRDLDGPDLRQMVAERMQRDVLVPLENRVSWVVTAIRNGPLLGLFGTVLGMMGAFGRIGTGDKVSPSQIAEEIAVALICTALGLGTAIPLGYVASALHMRISALQELTTPAIVRVLNALKPIHS
jgi:biopolymer transport protein ExbB/TolQ